MPVKKPQVKSITVEYLIGKPSSSVFGKRPTGVWTVDVRTEKGTAAPGEMPNESWRGPYSFHTSKEVTAFIASDKRKQKAKTTLNIKFIVSR
jgi:hypothetical protein